MALKASVSRLIFMAFHSAYKRLQKENGAESGKTKYRVQPGQEGKGKKKQNHINA